jgi:dTMP kinase
VELVAMIVNTYPGLYVALEGIDGAGTTTHARIAVRVLRRLGICAVESRQPGSKLLASVIKQLLRQGGPQHVLALSFAADRLMVEMQILDSLKRGCVVVSDRSVVSSLAYQPAGDEVDIEWVVAVNRYALLPDLVVYLDVDPVVAARRIARRVARDMFETITWLRALRRSYDRVLPLLEEAGVAVARIDAGADGSEPPVEAVSRRVLSAILAAYYTRTSLATNPPAHLDVWG